MLSSKMTLYWAPERPRKPFEVWPLRFYYPKGSPPARPSDPKIPGDSLPGLPGPQMLGNSIWVVKPQRPNLKFFQRHQIKKLSPFSGSVDQV